MATEKKCFIIMPITTPDFMLGKYRDGKEHFKHVLECLFVPGVQKAGYQVISPIAKGSDLIHAGIVHNLETADIVLCDMSCLNPNVFFEFGIRTSLNKPVSVVKDELTDKVPFDTAILNYHQYKSSLESWYLEAEVKALSEHITASADRSKNENTLWKYFGLRTTAAPSEGEGGTEAKLDYLLMKVDSLSKTIGWLRAAGKPRDGIVEANWSDILGRVTDLMLLMPSGPTARRIDRSLKGWRVRYEGRKLSADENAIISTVIKGEFGDDIELVHQNMVNSSQSTSGR